MKKSSGGVTVEKRPEYGKELTLSELEQFVFRAREVGVPDLARIKVRASFGAGLRQITVSSVDIVPQVDGGQAGESR